MNPFMAFYSLASPGEKYFRGTLRLPFPPDPALADCVIDDVRSVSHLFDPFPALKSSRGLAPPPRALPSPNPMILQGILVILAQRMAFPVLGEEDAGQVGMAGEPDA